MVEVAALGVRPDQPVEIARLELVRRAHERLEVADPEIAHPRGERVAEGHGAQGRIAARAAAPDREPFPIDDPPGREPASARHAIGEIDDTPLAFEPLAVGHAVAGRAAVIDVEDGEATSRHRNHDFGVAKPEFLAKLSWRGS